MGCKCARVAPADPQPVVTNKPSRREDPPLINVQPTSRDNDEEEENDRLIDQLLRISQQTKQSNNFVDIEEVDPIAFNTSFLRQRQQVIDNPSYRSTIDSWQCSSLESLARRIQKQTTQKSLVECHWIIFYWIASNIEYDTVSYFSKNYADQSAEIVFQRRKGVCAGYANLYKYLCDYLSIPCEIVGGYAKGYGFDSRAEAPTETDHAWNAVQIDSHWYLMESTWGAGSLTDQKQFKRQLNSYYFLPRPKEMIYHHLPENPRWQLLAQTISMEQYWTMPQFNSDYFALDLELIYPRNQSHLELLPKRSFALVLIKAPSDVNLIADLKMNDQKIRGGHRVIFDKKRRLFCCYFAPPSLGTYQAMIYGRRTTNEEDTGTHSAAVHLSFDIKTLPKTPISYPETWKRFYDLNLKLVSPKDTYIIRLQSGLGFAEIQIRTPKDVELSGRLENHRKEKIQGGEQVYYDRHQELWRCFFAPNDNGLFDAMIFARQRSDGGSYTSAITFQIQANKIPQPTVSYPTIWQTFYDLDLKIDVPKNRSSVVWPENASFVEVRIEAPDDVVLSCEIRYKNVRVENGSLAQYDHDKCHWQLLFAPQQTGLHQLIVFARCESKKESTSSYVVQFDLNVTKLRHRLIFPLTYGKFSSHRCRIYEPLNGVLKRDTLVPIHCVIPGATEVNFTVDSKWTSQSNYNDPILKTSVQTGSNDVTIYGRFDEGTNYNGLVKYFVQ